MPACVDRSFKGEGWGGIDAHYKSKHERDTGIEYANSGGQVSVQGTRDGSGSGC